MSQEHKHDQVRSRNEPFVSRTVTRIWQETPSNDNPYIAAMLERIDAGVGSIMKTLEETGLDKNTLIVFFSDNGGPGKYSNNGGLRAGKSWLYEGGIRESLIMRWPEKIKPNTVTDVPVCS
ncbi:MAG: hypothetical protein EOO68_17445, partial [Moraxellaceae bacterium]